jgi:hypothetical protein
VKRSRVSALCVGVAAAGLFVVLWSAGARADVVRTYDFSGTLTTPFNGDDSVSGFFVLDQTNATLENFSFKTPTGTFDKTNSGGSVATFTPASSPRADFVELVANGSPGLIALLFETPLLNFDGDTFYTGPVLVAPGLGTRARYYTYSPSFGSGFTGGAATPAIPEPPTWVAMALGFLSLVGLSRTMTPKATAYRCATSET